MRFYFVLDIDIDGNTDIDIDVDTDIVSDIEIMDISTDMSISISVLISQSISILISITSSFLQGRTTRKNTRLTLIFSYSRPVLMNTGINVASSVAQRIRELMLLLPGPDYYEY
jgi:hypothetical protein